MEINETSQNFAVTCGTYYIKMVDNKAMLVDTYEEATKYKNKLEVIHEAKLVGGKIIKVTTETKRTVEILE